MKTIEIMKNDSGQRLDKFLTKRFKTMPAALMYKYIRKKYIKLNGKKCDASVHLNTGDILTLFINDEFWNVPAPDRFDFLKASRMLDIVYEDENILLTDKKPGLIVHQDQSYEPDCLINRIHHYLYHKKEYDPNQENSFAPSLANRIDRNTGGIVMAAKNAESLKILNSKIKNREVKKYYLCLVFGTLKNKSGTLIHYLEKNELQNKVYLSEHPNEKSKIIKTKYEVLDESNNMSLLKAELLTGRTHQIRAHFSHIGHPLVGDGKYGTNAQNKKAGLYKQALYSYKLMFDFQSDAGILNYLNQKEFSVSNVWFEKNGRIKIIN